MKTIKIRNFREILIHLKKELDDENIRNAFIFDPNEFISKYINNNDKKINKLISPISFANKFLYSLISNQAFRFWFNEYTKKLINNLKNNPDMKLDRTIIIQELLYAFKKFGNYSILVLATDEEDDSGFFWHYKWVAVHTAVAYTFAVAGGLAVVACLVALIEEPWAPRIESEENELNYLEQLRALNELLNPSGMRRLLEQSKFI